MSQIVRHNSAPHYLHTENGSKSLHQIQVEYDVVVFSYPGASVHCYFSILEKYISKLPPVAHKKMSYMKALDDNVVLKPGKPWYDAQPCGQNKLARMCFPKLPFQEKLIIVSGQPVLLKYSKQEFQKKIIQERTGHRLTEALCMYKQTTTTQHMAIARVLCAGKDQNCGFKTSVCRAPYKQSTTTAGTVFSTTFGTVLSMSV